jgi:hypothetical protein
MLKSQWLRGEGKALIFHQGVVRVPRLRHGKGLDAILTDCCSLEGRTGGRSPRNDPVTMRPGLFSKQHRV